MGAPSPDLRWNGTQAVRHLPEIQFCQGKYPSYSLNFDWSGNG
jgi:hypothetical protein